MFSFIFLRNIIDKSSSDNAIWLVWIELPNSRVLHLRSHCFGWNLNHCTSSTVDTIKDETCKHLNDVADTWIIFNISMAVQYQIDILNKDAALDQNSRPVQYIKAIPPPTQTPGTTPRNLSPWGLPVHKLSIIMTSQHATHTTQSSALQCMPAIRLDRFVITTRFWLAP